MAEKTVTVEMPEMLPAVVDIKSVCPMEYHWDSYGIKEVVLASETVVMVIMVLIILPMAAAAVAAAIPVAVAAVSVAAAVAVAVMLTRPG